MAKDLVGDDELTDDEIERYRFRVGRMRFEQLVDAITFAEASLPELYVHVRIDGAWRLIWEHHTIVRIAPGMIRPIPTRKLVSPRQASEAKCPGWDYTARTLSE